MEKMVRFNKVQNDLFWETTINGKTVQWIGYDDSFWWSKVAVTYSFQNKDGLRLDPFANTVLVVSEPEAVK